MADFNYARARQTAERLIQKFGQVGAIRRYTITGTDYDPVRTHQDFPCRLVDLDYDDGVIDGTLIKRGDRRVLLSTAGLSIQPEKDDGIIIGGAESSVKDTLPLSPAGTVVFWQIQARN